MAVDTGAHRGSPLRPIAAARANGFGLTVLPAPQSGPGWHHAHALTRESALRDELIARANASSGSDLEAVGVAWLLENHAWQTGSLVVAALLSGTMLPPLDLAQLRYGAAGWADAIAVPETGWVHGGPVEAAVALDAHLAPVIDALNGRRAPRALWREAGDRIGQAVIWCGEAFDAREEAWSLGAQILAAPTRLRGPARFELRDGLPFRQRSGCCLAHRVPEGVACADCLLARPTVTSGG